MGKLGASGDLKVAYVNAEAQLIKDPLAPVAGWTALGRPVRTRTASKASAGRFAPASISMWSSA